jgi:hypothetical protein
LPRAIVPGGGSDVTQTQAKGPGRAPTPESAPATASPPRAPAKSATDAKPCPPQVAALGLCTP